MQRLKKNVIDLQIMRYEKKKKEISFFNLYFISPFLFFVDRERVFGIFS